MNTEASEVLHVNVDACACTCGCPSSKHARSSCTRKQQSARRARSRCKLNEVDWHIPLLFGRFATASCCLLATVLALGRAKRVSRKPTLFTSRTAARASPRVAPGCRPSSGLPRTPDPPKRKRTGSQHAAPPVSRAVQRQAAGQRQQQQSSVQVRAEDTPA